MTNRIRVHFFGPALLLLMAALLAACGGDPQVTLPSSGTPDMAAQPYSCADDPACSGERDVSEFKMLHPPFGGAMSERDAPSTETLLEQGLYGAGATPAHIGILGMPVANSVRCEWHDIVMTNAQREAAVRFFLEMDEEVAFPSTSDLRIVFNTYKSQIAAEHRAAMGANFDHLVQGGVMTDGQILACYVDYTVSEYLLGAGPNTLTVAYEGMDKSGSYAIYTSEHTAGAFGTDPLLTADAYAAAEAAKATAMETTITDTVAGRRAVLLLAPMAAHHNIAVQVWQVIAQWDVQTTDGVDHAVRYGVYEGSPRYSQTLAELKTKIAGAANDNPVEERLANANDLPNYYRDNGAYGNIAPDDQPAVIFTPELPPATGDDPAPPTSAPAIPSNVTLSTTPHKGVWITWDASSDQTITGYQILRRIRGIDSTTFVLIDDTGNTTPAFLDDQGIRLGYNHIYRIAARNSQGLSTPSVRVTVKPPLPGVQNFTTSSTADNVTLRWDREGWSDLDHSTVTGYRVMRHLQGEDAFEAVTDIGKTDTVYTDWYDISQGTYIYRVQTVAGDLMTPGVRSEIAVPAPVDGVPRSDVSSAPLYMTVSRAGDNFLVHWDGQTTVDGQTTTAYTLEMSTDAHGPWVVPSYYEPSGGRQCGAKMPIPAAANGCTLVFTGAGIPTDVASTRYFRLIVRGSDAVAETGPVREVQITASSSDN